MLPLLQPPAALGIRQLSQGKPDARAERDRGQTTSHEAEAGGSAEAVASGGLIFLLAGRLLQPQRRHDLDPALLARAYLGVYVAFLKPGVAVI